jgi:hypothetical protein
MIPAPAIKAVPRQRDTKKRLIVIIEEISFYEVVVCCEKKQAMHKGLAAMPRLSRWIASARQENSLPICGVTCFQAER